VPERRRRRADSRRKLLEESLQAFVIQPCGSLDHLCNRGFMTRFNDAGKGLGEIRRQRIHQSRV